MDIAICINENYLMPSGVMLCSLFENNKEEHIVVHALLGKDGDKCKQPLKDLTSKYHQKILFYDMSQISMDDFPVGLHFQES